MWKLLNDSCYFQKNIVGRSKVNGLVISTAITTDYGLETAIIDKNGIYPVERYDDIEEAKIGHINWSEKAGSIKKIFMLEWAGGLVKSERVELVRYDEEDTVWNIL